MKYPAMTCLLKWLLLPAIAPAIILAAEPQTSTTPPAPAGTPELTVPVPAPAPFPAPENKLSASSFVRVNSTNQPYNFVRPWAKKAPFSRRGIGVVIEGGQILVTAELVADHTYVEIERPKDSAKSPATVEHIDYETNLALLEPQEPEFLADAEAVELAQPLEVGDQVEIAQLERNGLVATTPGTVTTITVSSYPVDGIALLTYTVSAPLQYRDNSFTLPIFRLGKLAGLLMRYDARSQTATLIPGPIIEGFLSRTRMEKFSGFPKAGLAYAPTRDPQFRKFLNMDDSQSGIYVSKVLEGSAADKAGIEKGDVVLEIAGHSIDNDGNYNDPDFGLIPLAHLVSSADPKLEKLPIQVLRDGEVLSLSLPLEPRDPSNIISPTILDNRRPRFVIVGGIVFQELSRPFLEEWGPDWRDSAPQKLVYLDAFQDELQIDGGRIVFVSQVLPTDATIGYENLGAVVVTEVNGTKIGSLEDLKDALAKPVDGFHKIEFDSDPGAIYLDAKQASDIAPQIQQIYGLPSLEFLR